MARAKQYFFCGIGGSGMLPLALIVKARGASVAGSDRALDQGRLAAKFDFLRREGIALYPQDGSGIVSAGTVVVTSTAVEETVPDVQAARRVGARMMTRAELLAQLFNEAPNPIGVAGTSGKSTVTGMTGFILAQCGFDPTVMNGAIMKNFVTPDIPFASALVGKGDLFVSEVDESDGSIARFHPKVAVLNNIALDHKSMDELRALFRAFVGRSDLAVLNLDNAETAAIAHELHPSRRITFSLSEPKADLLASNIEPMPDGIAFEVSERHAGRPARLRLKVPGRHNVANALAALGAARAAGLRLSDAAAALSNFAGIRRRLEVVGTAGGVTVIDDFAHNPDKIAATLATLHDFPGRLLAVFQPHGFGPLKLMQREFVACFAQHLRDNDVLLMPEPVYYGGTTDRAVSSDAIVQAVQTKERQAEAFSGREALEKRLLALAQRGDRIVVMGARDDTLTEFAQSLVAQLGKREAAT